MKIVSYIRDSFQEFEGYQSLVLFSKSCNFNCSGCYNYDHVTYDEPIADAITTIDNLITPMHEAVVFLGGEPTIWGTQLIEAARWAKQKGLKVKVFSNGFNASVISALNARKLVDAWSLDLKCIRDSETILGTDIPISEYLKAVKCAVYNIKSHNLPIEIRTTLWPSMADQQQEIEAYVKKHFPNVKHILQRDFSTNLRLASA